MSKRQTVRCTFTLADGTRCGKRAWADDPLQLCSVHGQGKVPVDHQFQPKDEDVDPLTVVRRVMRRSKNDNDRLRAADLYVRMLERQSDKPKMASNLDVKLLTASERAAFTALFEAFRDLLRRVWQRAPNAVTGEHSDRFAREAAHAELQRQQLEKEKRRESVQQRDQPAGTGPEVSEPPAVAAEAAAADEPAEVKPLPQSMYAAVGLYVVNGVVTHDLSDDHARKILNGEIPFAEAEAAQRAADKHVNQFAAAMRVKKAKEQKS